MVDTARPNIIFLMTDQQRWDALGAHNPQVKTPTLDGMIANGLLFTNATCQAPMCVPSRFSMMTGLYPSQSGVRANWWETPDDAELPLPVLPQMMKDAGYLTAGFGKTHWGSTASIPSTRGFDVRVVGVSTLGEESGATHWQDDEDSEGAAAYADAIRDYGPGEEEPAGYLGVGSPIPQNYHPDGWIAEKALEWLDGPDVDTDAPLFFYLSFQKPHASHIPPAEFQEMYDVDAIPDLIMPPWDGVRYDHIAVRDAHSPFLGARSTRWREAWESLATPARRLVTLRYWANCTWLDSLMGKALDKLEQRGRLDNAMIVFVSDHGELLGERRYQFSKYCLYDSSVRVPLILSGTALDARSRNTRSTEPAELVDLYPTLAAIAGHAIPPGMPGRSLLTQPSRRGSFAEMHEPEPAWMWRTPTHKLIVFVDPDRDDLQGELYDLAKDPEEWINLYDDEGSALIRAQLTAQLVKHVATTFSRWPTHVSERTVIHTPDSLRPAATTRRP